MNDEPRNRNHLPKWAVRVMEQLERRNAELRRENDRLHAALAGDGGSPFKISVGMRDDDVALPSFAKYLLWSPTGEHGGFELRLRSEGNELEVMCSTHHGVAVVPQASNVVRIRPGRV